MSRFAGAGRAGAPGAAVLPLVPSSSSSTLSPLAPPFTVDRPLPAVINPGPLSPPPPAAPTHRIFSSSVPSNSVYPWSSGACAAPYFVPTGGTVWSSCSSTATATISRTDPLNSAFGSVEAPRYYSYYEPVLDSVNDPLNDQPDFKGSVRAWNGPFDIEEGRPGRGSVTNSFWANHGPSCKASAPLQRTTESFSEHEDSFGSWHAAYNDYSSLQDHAGSECSEWLDRRNLGKYVENTAVPIDGCGSADLSTTTVWSNHGSHHFQTLELASLLKERDTYVPNSYDGYIAQLTSCSRDPMVHYPAMTSFSGQGFVPSKERNESFVDWSFFKEVSPATHVNLYKKNDDFLGYNIDCKRNEAMTCQNSEVKEAHVKMNITGNSMQRNSGEAVASPSMLKGQSVDCSADVKSNVEVAKLSCSKASICGKSASSSDDTIQASLEVSDQLNVAVDSPCWKGASVSRHYPFDFDEVIQNDVANVTTSGDDVNLGEKPLKVHSYLKQDDRFVCRENGKDIQSSMSKNLSPVTVDLSCTDLKLKESSGRGLNPAKIENAKGTQLPDTLEEKMNKLIEQNVRVTEGIDNNARQFAHAENVKSSSLAGEPILAGKNTDHGANNMVHVADYFSSSDHCTSSSAMNISSPNIINPLEFEAPGSSDTAGKRSSQRQDAQMLVQAMLSLSEVLLYHHCNEADALENCDLKLVQHVINNLVAFLSKREKGITGSSSLDWVEENRSHLTKSNADKGICEDKKDTMQSKILMGSINDDKHDNLSKKLFTYNVGDSDHKVQAFSKDFKKAFSEQEEEPAMIFYKNLWVQTEAALWSMKHDVALMKLEMENFKHHWKADCLDESNKLAKLVNVMSLPEWAPSKASAEHDLHSCIEHGGSRKVTSTSSEDSSKCKTVEKIQRYNSLEEDVADAPVIARLRILKGRYDATDLGGKDDCLGLYASHSTHMDELDSVPKISTVISPEMNRQGKKHPLDYKKVTKQIDMSVIAAAGAAEPLHFTADDPAIQSYKNQNHGKWLLRSGSDCTSSDWEHVLKDEFM